MFGKVKGIYSQVKYKYFALLLLICSIVLFNIRFNFLFLNYRQDVDPAHKFGCKNSIATYSYIIVNNSVTREKNTSSSYNELLHGKYFEKFCSRDRYEMLVQPCIKIMHWHNRIRDDFLTTSVIYSQVQIYIRPAKYFSEIKIISYDVRKRRKVIGGDDWRVFLRSKHFSFNVKMTDNMDGSYEGIFLPLYSGEYTLTGVLDYTLCRGILDPPTDFYARGSFQGKNHNESVLDECDNFLNKPLFTKYIVVPHNSKHFPQIRGSKERKCFELNDACVYWFNNTLKTYGDDEKVSVNRISMQAPNISFLSGKNTSLHFLRIYGDSLGVRFGESILKKEICQRVFKKCDYIYLWVYRINTYYLQNGKPEQKHEFYDSFFLKDIRDSFETKDFLRNDSFILVNFGLHLLRVLPLEKILRIFHLFLSYMEGLKSRLGKNYPQIIWKTTTQPHFETTSNYKPPIKRFHTKQRVDAWNAYVTEALCKNQIPILNVDTMGSSFYRGTVDAVHYANEVFFPAEDALKKYAEAFLFKLQKKE